MRINFFKLVRRESSNRVSYAYRSKRAMGRETVYKIICIRLKNN
jgi:hypothetical protein